MVGKYQILVKVSSPEGKQEKRLTRFYQDRAEDITAFASPTSESASG
jgi:hypothetical protein